MKNEFEVTEEEGGETKGAMGAYSYAIAPTILLDPEGIPKGAGAPGWSWEEGREEKEGCMG